MTYVTRINHLKHTDKNPFNNLFIIIYPSGPMDSRNEPREIIRLDLNENHLLCEEYYETLVSDLDIDISDYPSEYSEELCQSIAGHIGVRPDQVMVANGSDEVLEIIFKTMVSKDGVLGYYEPTYGYYSLIANTNDIKVVEIPLKSDFTLPGIDGFVDDIDALVVCSPNNPTSLTVDKRYIRALLERDVVVIVDEVYAEFSSEDCLDLIDDHENLLICRTFSKAWGLAGIRIGYAVSDNDNIMQLIENMRAYCVNTLSQSIAMSAIDNSHHMERSLEKTLKEREYLSEGLEEIDFNVLPSETNFLFCRPPTGIDPFEISRALEERGILVKTFEEARINDFLRITVGTRDINDRLIEELEDILDS